MNFIWKLSILFFAFMISGSANASPGNQHNLWESRTPQHVFAGWELECRLLPTQAVVAIPNGSGIYIHDGFSICEATGPNGSGIDTYGIDLIGDAMVHRASGSAVPDSHDGSDSWTYTGETFKQVYIVHEYYRDILGFLFYDDMTITFDFWYTDSSTGGAKVSVFSSQSFGLDPQENRYGRDFFGNDP